MANYLILIYRGPQERQAQGDEVAPRTASSCSVVHALCGAVRALESAETATSVRSDGRGGFTVYEFFSLRDGISDGNWQNGFGLLHDDYTPKPAYTAVRQLIGAT